MAISPISTRQTTATTGVDPVANQRAVNTALDSLSANVFNIGDQQVDLMDFGLLEEISQSRQTAANQIRALATQQPPLTADQIKTQADAIVKSFREESALLNMMVYGEFSTSLMMMNWTSQMLG